MRPVAGSDSAPPRLVVRDPVAFLEDWYAQQCDADWEHEFGIKIDTLDNPGWRIEINLEGTSWQGRELDRQVVERSEHDWLHAWSDGRRWQAACGPQNLGGVIRVFREFLGPPVAVDRYASDSGGADAVEKGPPRIRYEPPEPGWPA
jgi:hypothetical protein